MTIRLEDYAPQVRVLATRIARRFPAFDRDDLYQEGMIGLDAAIVRYEPEQQPEFWAYAQFRVLGRMRDHVRKAARRPLDVAADDVAEPTIEPTVESGSSLPVIIEEIGKLPRVDMAVTALYYFGDLYHKEIGALLDFSIERSCQLLRRAHRRLAPGLADCREDLRTLSDLGVSASSRTPRLDPAVAIFTGPPTPAAWRLEGDLVDALARIPIELQAAVADLVLRRRQRRYAMIDDGRGAS